MSIELSAISKHHFNMIERFLKATLITVLMHSICKATSDWIMSKILDGIFCDILSETQRPHVILLFIGCNWVLHSSQHCLLCANSASFLTKQMVRCVITTFRGSPGILKLMKCIRMGITILKIFNWGGTYVVVFTVRNFVLLLHCKRKFQTIKLTIYLPK